ncbi:MAG: ferrochelatase [Bradymonadales bacterium]
MKSSLERKEKENVIMLINAGSPRSTELTQVKQYLSVYLTDKHVIQLPFLLRHLLMRLFIVPRRARLAQRRYMRLCQQNHGAFPLISTMLSLAKKLEFTLNTPVYMASRFGQYDIKTQLFIIHKKHPEVKKIIAIPLYPQSTDSCTTTAVEHLRKCAKKLVPKASIQIIAPYYQSEHYYAALSQTIQPYLSSKFERLLVSFHSIPLSHLRCSCAKDSDIACTDCAKTPCYKCQCEFSFHKICALANIPKNKIELVYQSQMRSGGEWLGPKLHERLSTLAQEGARNILVICPGFCCDCLETLDEIAITAKDTFLAAGGRKLELVPCLNDSPAAIQLLTALLQNTC